MATTIASLEEELQTKNQQVKQYKKQVDAVKTELAKYQEELRIAQARLQVQDEGQRSGDDLRRALDENRVLHQKLQQAEQRQREVPEAKSNDERYSATESGRETLEELKQRLKEAEAKVNEYRAAIDAKEKSYKRMLEIARKSTGGKSLDWMVEVLDRGPSQNGKQEESEVILWSAVEEYYRKRKTMEQGSVQGEYAELSAEIKELKDINKKQSMELAREHKRNEELTKAASLQTQSNSQLEEAKCGRESELAALQEENKGLMKKAEYLHKELTTLRNQSVMSSQSSSEDAMECKKLSTEVQFLQNELKKQRARCTELEVNLRSMGSSSTSSSGQACKFCEVLRAQLAEKEGAVTAAERALAAKESALAERDGRLSLMTTRLQKFELVGQNAAEIVAESKRMAAFKSDLENRLGKLQMENRDLAEKCTGLNMQLDTARKTISQLDEATRRQAAAGSEIEELRRSVVELKGRNGDLMNRNGDLMTTINDLNRKYADLMNMNGDLERQLERARDDRSKQELRDKLALYESQAQVYENDFKQERRDRENLHAKFNTLEEEFKVRENCLQTDLGQKEQECGTLRWRCSEMERRCAEIEQKYIQTDRQRSEIQHNYIMLQQQVGELHNDMQVKNQQVKQYKTQLDQCKEKVASYEAILHGGGGYHS